MNTDTLMSKATYASFVAAQRACEKAGKVFAGVHKLPSGRVVYLHTIKVS